MFFNLALEKVIWGAGVNARETGFGHKVKALTGQHNDHAIPHVLLGDLDS